MTKRFYLLIFHFAFTFFSVAAQPDKLTLARQMEDFTIFKGGLKEGHGGLYSFIDSASFAQQCDSIQRTFTDNAPVGTFYLKLRYLTTLLRHGHTRINLPFAHGINFRMDVLLQDRSYLPMRIAIYDRRVFVHTDCSDKGSLKKGTEILEINGVPVSRLMDSMLHYLSADGRNTTFKYYFLYNYYHFHFLYQLLYPDVTRFSLTLAGQKKPVFLNAKTPKEIEAAYLARNGQGPSHFEDPLSYQAAIAPNTAYLKAGSFYKGFIESFGKQSEPFVDSVFRDISQRGTGNLIIDLRDNEGGGDHYNDYLFSYLSSKPFMGNGFDQVPGKTFPFVKYAEQLSDDVKAFTQNPAPFLRDDSSLLLREEFMDRKMFLPAKPGFRGRIYVLTNGGTFSAGNSFVRSLYQYRQTSNPSILFVGEENGGDINSTGGCAGTSYIIRLPNSGIAVDMPFLCEGTRHQMLPQKTLPDIRVYPSGKDLSAGYDRVLNHVLKQLVATKAAHPVLSQPVTKDKQSK